MGSEGDLSHNNHVHSHPLRLRNQPLRWWIFRLGFGFRSPSLVCCHHLSRRWLSRYVIISFPSHFHNFSETKHWVMMWMNCWLAVFTYTPLHDVLEVEQSDYDMCRISDPLKTYRDGETVIQLSEADNRYFICGRLGHCDMGLKLQVQVQTTDGNSTGGSGQEQRQRGRGRSSPPPHSPGPDHDHESPPSNRSRDHKPESPDSASVSQPPVANPPFNTSAGCSHVESSLCLNCWCLPFITTLLLLIVIFSSCPDRQMLSFFFNFSHLSYVIWLRVRCRFTTSFWWLLLAR